MKSNIAKSIATIMALIIIGGILTSIGIAIFEPAYVYPSIGDFVFSFVMGGYVFVTILGILACILVPED